MRPAISIPPSGFSGQRSARRLLAITLLCFTPLLLLAAPVDNNARFNQLGHKMICACGCNQILLECNHVGCPLSDGMRNELAAGIQRFPIEAPVTSRRQHE